MSNPEYVKVDNELYKINSDFRNVIECNTIAVDQSIGGYERSLAIVYKLFGEKGLECRNTGKLLELGLTFIAKGKKPDKDEHKNKDKFSLDLAKCVGLIKSSFKYDYNYDPYELEYLHWYDFYNDLENLSNNEFGTCCVLNRITGVLYADPSKIKDNKERTKLVEAQKELKEKYCYSNEKQQTEAQRKSAEEFYKSIGIEW